MRAAWQAAARRAAQAWLRSPVPPAQRAFVDEWLGVLRAALGALRPPPAPGGPPPPGMHGAAAAAPGADACAAAGQEAAAAPGGVGGAIEALSTDSKREADAAVGSCGGLRDAGVSPGQQSAPAGSPQQGGAPEGAAPAVSAEDRGPAAGSAPQDGAVPSGGVHQRFGSLPEPGSAAAQCSALSAPLPGLPDNQGIEAAAGGLDRGAAAVASGSLRDLTGLLADGTGPAERVEGLPRGFPRGFALSEVLDALRELGSLHVTLALAATTGLVPTFQELSSHEVCLVSSWLARHACSGTPCCLWQ